MIISELAYNQQELTPLISHYLLSVSQITTTHDEVLRQQTILLKSKLSPVETVKKETERAQV